MMSRVSPQFGKLIVVAAGALLLAMCVKTARAAESANRIAQTGTNSNKRLESELRARRAAPPAQSAANARSQGLVGAQIVENKYVDEAYDEEYEDEYEWDAREKIQVPSRPAGRPRLTPPANEPAAMPSATSRGYAAPSQLPPRKFPVVEEQISRAHMEEPEAAPRRPEPVRRPPAAYEDQPYGAGVPRYEHYEESPPWYSEDFHGPNMKPDWGSAVREGRYFFGGEALFVRPSFSEAIAFMQEVRPDDFDDDGVLHNQDNTIYHSFNYEASYRLFAGIRFDDCCNELRFSYWRLRGSADTSATAGVDENGNPVQYTIWKVNAAFPGDVINSGMNVYGDIYDIEFARCIRMGDECAGGVPCGGCGDCQDCCFVGCPRWDFQWKAGIRIANMGYDNYVSAFDTLTDESRSARGRMRFQGVGPKVGVLATRYFNVLPGLSVYADWNASLLVGDYDHLFERRSTLPTENMTISSYHGNTTRVIPVTDIELGVRYQATRRLTFSGGYMIQSWWDLGMTESQPTITDQDELLFFRDDSNIMGWDGWVARAEYRF